MRALCYAQTNIGSGRDNNEDNYYCNGTFKRDPAIPVAEAAAEQESRRLIYGVFDGMGGEANGEQAALLCAQTLHQCSSDEPFDALDFFRRANVAVCDMIAPSMPRYCVSTCLSGLSAASAAAAPASSCS